MTRMSNNMLIVKIGLAMSYPLKQGISYTCLHNEGARFCYFLTIKKARPRLKTMVWKYPLQYVDNAKCLGVKWNSGGVCVIFTTSLSNFHVMYFLSTHKSRTFPIRWKEPFHVFSNNKWNEMKWVHMWLSTTLFTAIGLTM